MAIYEYRLAWLISALATYEAPNFDEGDGVVDVKLFPQFCTSQKKVNYHVPRALEQQVLQITSYVGGML